MRRMMLFLFLIPLSFEGVGQGKDNISLFFEGKVFWVPAGFSSIASLSENSRIIYFKYGKDQGRTYIAFSDGLGNENVDVGCDSADFLKSVFEPDVITGCNVEMVRTFAESFVEGQDAGVWRGKEDVTIYYSVGEALSFLFVVDKKHKPMKIDTDFLSKEALKKVVKNIL